MAFVPAYAMDLEPSLGAMDPEASMGSSADSDDYHKAVNNINEKVATNTGMDSEPSMSSIEKNFNEAEEIPVGEPDLSTFPFQAFAEHALVQYPPAKAQRKVEPVGDSHICCAYWLYAGSKHYSEPVEDGSPGTFTCSYKLVLKLFRDSPRLNDRNGVEDALVQALQHVRSAFEEDKRLQQKGSIRLKVSEFRSIIPSWTNAAILTYKEDIRVTWEPSVKFVEIDDTDECADFMKVFPQERDDDGRLDGGESCREDRGLLEDRYDSETRRRLVKLPISSLLSEVTSANKDA